MSVPYLFSLNNKDRVDLFLAAGTETGLPAYVVEKDYYVTLVLKLLFEQLKPDCLEKTATPFMFKGGTTLSKVGFWGLSVLKRHNPLQPLSTVASRGVLTFS